MIDDLARKNQLARISADLARKSVVSAEKKIPAIFITNGNFRYNEPWTVSKRPSQVTAFDQYGMLAGDTYTLGRNRESGG